MPTIQVRGEAVAQTTFEVKHDKYIRFWETYIDHKGLERKRLWTAWFDTEQAVGTSESIIIEGELLCKIGTYVQKSTGQEKQNVEYVLNNAVFIAREGAIRSMGTSLAADEDIPF